MSAPLPTTAELEQVNRGRLLSLKLKHNHAARVGALASIRERYTAALIDRRTGRIQQGPFYFDARIGGKVRGKTLYFSTREAAERAVNDHYNDKMMEFLGRDRSMSRNQDTKRKTVYRWKVVHDPDAQFEECNGKSEPLTEAEYAENYYLDKDTDTQVSYDRYLEYYGNPDRHVYLGVILEAKCPCCGQWEQKGSLWGIDVMDDTSEAGAVDWSTERLEELPGYLQDVGNDLEREARRG